MIIIDRPNLDGWCHLAGDNITALHSFAQNIGLKRCWFQNKRGKNQPHYDVRGAMIQRAISAGAEQVGNKELWLFLDEHYNKSPV